MDRDDAVGIVQGLNMQSRGQSESAECVDRNDQGHHNVRLRCELRLQKWRHDCRPIRITNRMTVAIPVANNSLVISSFASGNLLGRSRLMTERSPREMATSLPEPPASPPEDPAPPVILNHQAIHRRILRRHLHHRFRQPKL